MMGWGSASRKPAAAPQPVKKAVVTDLDGHPVSDRPRKRAPVAALLKPITSTASAPVEDEEIVVDEKPKKGHDDEMAWMKFRSQFALETANMIVLDFVRERGLFAELVKFARKRKR